MSSVDAGLESLAVAVPDLILTTTFLPPAEELKLRDHLRHSPNTSHVQVIALPQFDVSTIESDIASSGRVLPFRRHGAVVRLNADVLRQHISEYLQQASARRLALQNRPETGAPLSSEGPSRHADRPPVFPSSTGIELAGPDELQEVTAGLRLPTDRRRATRRRAADLGGRWSIRLVPEGEASILDISRSGVLLETRSRLTPGGMVDLHIRGVTKNLSVAARLLRSESANATGRHASYRVAAAFSRELDLFASDRPASAPTPVHPPKVLGDLLARVLADATWVSNGTTLCTTYEAEIAGLVRARAVRIGPSGSAPTAPDCRTASFEIPGAANAQIALHVLFEPGYQPTPFDARVLTAAATLAAVVFELAPSARLHSPII